MVGSNIQFDEGAPLLEVEDIVVEYETREKGAIRAVDGVSFTLGHNDTFGLVGESGCGKSTIAQAILGLLPQNGRVESGSIRFKGVDLLDCSKAELDRIRWEHISMISQSAMNALNPVQRISNQIVEAIQNHRDVSKSEALDRVRELFELVGLNPERITEYPHQFSGGMRQRAYIAMALALDPDIVIADEPTTALDVIVQDQILKRINELQDELDISMILITHDISVIAETSDRLGVMYAGKMMEYGELASIFQRPYNPYMLGLRNAFPNVSGEKQNLISIPGTPPDPSSPPDGCRFIGRCPFATDECRSHHPPLEEVEPDHYSACFRHEDIEQMRTAATQRETWEQRGEQTVSADGGQTEGDEA